MSEKETKRASGCEKRDRTEAKTNQMERTLCEKEEPWIKHQEVWDPSKGHISVTKGKKKSILFSSLIEEHTCLQHRGVLKIKMLM